MPRERTVLHVLPHPGGGGETYIDALVEMGGYRFDRVYLAPSAKASGSRAAILRRVVQVQRAALSFDVLHIVGEVASTLCFPVLALRPSVISPQGLHLLRRLEGVGKRVGKANLRLIVQTASRTICAANSEYVDVVNSVGRRVARRVLVINNGVRLADPVSPERRVALRAELGIPISGLVGAWVAALDEHKDPLCAIRAVNAIRRDQEAVTLLVAGDGPLRSEVERAARETDAVHVLGFRQDVERILSASDFFVLSSQREGLSFSLLEAMSLGLTPVVSDAPANAEAVANAGIVVPFGNVEGFAKAFRRLLNEPERRALGAQARTRVHEHFDVDVMRLRTREVYDEVTGTRRGE
jgi:glycosyltransferase involved in cell wall biosynthesis